MKAQSLSLHSTGIGIVFFFYFLFVYFLSVGQITDTSMLSQIIGSPVQAYSNNETSNAVLGMQDYQYETRLLAQADTGAGEDGVHYVCPVDRVDNQCEYVGAEGIQQAISLAQNGDVVELRTGVYDGDDVVEIGEYDGQKKNDITIRSESDSGVTTLRGFGFIIWNAQNITIEGLSLEGVSDKQGIVVAAGATNIYIKDLFVINFERGVFVEGKAVLEGNSIQFNDTYGVLIMADGSAEILNNDIISNGVSGITLSQGSEAVVIDNTITDNGEQIDVRYEGNTKYEARNNRCYPDDPDCSTDGDTPSEEDHNSELNNNDSLPDQSRSDSDQCPASVREASGEERRRKEVFFCAAYQNYHKAEFEEFGCPCGSGGGGSQEPEEDATDDSDRDEDQDQDERETNPGTDDAEVLGCYQREGTGEPTLPPEWDEDYDWTLQCSTKQVCGASKGSYDSKENRVACCEALGYSSDECNKTVRANNQEIPFYNNFICHGEVYYPDSPEDDRIHDACYMLDPVAGDIPMPDLP